VEIKHTIFIKQMESVPKDWTIHEYKEQGMLNTKQFLVNMLDSSMKQNLCVMLDINKRLQFWEEIANGNLFIFNGQHNIVASKDIQTLELPENIVKHFRKWNCFIVWSRDKSRLQ
jgi:hypothetical protein